EVSVDFGPFEQVNVVGGYESAIPGEVNNPLRGRPAFTDTSANTERLNSVDLSEFAGESIRLGFHVGWDDGNCAPQEGWFGDDVEAGGVLQELGGRQHDLRVGAALERQHARREVVGQERLRRFPAQRERAEVRLDVDVDDAEAVRLRGVEPGGVARQADGRA